MNDENLTVLQVVGALPGPRLLVTAGVHGDEFEGMIAIRHLADQLRSRMRRGTAVLVPVVNAAAFRRGQRCGEDGLDLARSCPGRADGSPTERIANAVSTHIRAADAYIDLHSGGCALAILPLCGYFLHRDPQVLARTRVLAAAFSAEVVWGTNSELEGRTLSVARDGGIPAIYAEYGGSGLLDPHGVEAYVHGTLRVAAHLGLIDAEPAARAPRWTIEDPRPGSGILQTQHPAPISGVFAATTRLGNRVRAGESLGEVVDPIGGMHVAITAAEDGVILMLRARAAVVAGDALAAILPIEVAHA